MNLDAIHRAYPAILSGELSAETNDKDILFVRGGNSDYITAPIIKQTLDIYPNAQFITIPDSGHWVHAEQPIEFLKISRQFLLTTG